MGHHSENIPILIRNTGNTTCCAIGICLCDNSTGFITIPVNNLILCFQVVKRFLIGIIPAFTMSYRNLQWTIRTYALNKNIFADILLVTVSQQHSWQKMRFTQNLEAVANTQGLSSLVRKFNHTL